MKTYKLTLLTPTGLVTEIYHDNQDLTQFEADMVIKYGQFVNIKSEEINP